MRKEVESNWELGVQKEQNDNFDLMEKNAKTDVAIGAVCLIAAVVYNLFFFNGFLSCFLIVYAVGVVIDGISRVWMRTTAGACICVGTSGIVLAYSVLIMLAEGGAIPILLTMLIGKRCYDLYGLVKLGYFTKEKQER